MKKRCTKCKQLKPKSAFKYRTATTARCRECNRDACRAWHAKHKGSYKEKRKEQWKIKRRAAVEFVILAKSKPCTDCGRTFHPVSMDFDHVRGKKSTEVSTLLRSGHSLDRIKREISKCEVVCACCHRVRTLYRSKSKSRPFSMYDTYSSSLRSSNAEQPVLTRTRVGSSPTGGTT